MSAPKSDFFVPSQSALLLIDHQVGTMQLVRNLPLERVKKFTLALAKMAKIFKIPTVLTSSQEDRVQGPLLPELAALLPEEHAARVKRAGIVDAWKDQNFRTAVEATGRKQLIMAGITTDVCLIYPSINAVRAGFQVQAVMDASGSPYELSEELSRARMREAGVILTATNTLMAELTQDWSTPEAAQLLPILFGEVLPPVLR